ncbi:MAG: hypothetical protein NVSMB25_08250 [Thermoleophilaceae bacterium]
MRIFQIFLALAVCSAWLALASAPARAALPFGFNDSWAPAEVDQTLPLAKRLGANSARLQLYWGTYEPRPGVYRFADVDATYRAMIAHGIRPLLNVVSAPGWAAAPGCTDIYRCQQSPAHDGAFAAFIRFMVARYPQAVGVEIGNEPNLARWTVAPDPARYAQILHAGFTAVKQANRNMPVITAGLCCTSISSTGNLSATRFLGALYASGIRGYYDYIGVHLYPGGPVDRVAPDLRSEMIAMRATRDAAGENARFWVTETGFPSAGVSPYGGGVFDEANQAEREAIAERVLRAMPDVGALFYYRLIDPAPSSTAGADMGFFHRDRTPKPAAGALVAALGAPPWPDFDLAAKARPTTRPGRSFRVRLTGRRPPEAIRYQWLVWHGDHWSRPVASTAAPSARMRLPRVGTYRVAVSVSTARDTYLSAATTVRVVGGHGTKHTRRRMRRRGTGRRKLHPTATGAQPAAPAGHAAPLAQLGADRTTIYPGQAVNFSGSASSVPGGDVVSYEWDLGDGALAQGEDRAIRTYWTPGSYHVRVRVTGDDGMAAIATRTVTVLPYPGPAARISCSASELRAFSRLRCRSDDSASPYPISRYRWNMGVPGSDGTSGSIRYAYANPGVYPVTLTVTDIHGATSTASTSVKVDDVPPRAMISPPANAAFVLGSPIAFDGSGSYDRAGRIVSYEWDDGLGGGFAAGGTTFAPSYLTAGFHTVALRVTNDQGQSSTAEYGFTIL